MRSLEGKIAVVTGATRGIGKGTAIALGEQGCTVYVTGRSSGSGDRTVEATAQAVKEAGGEGRPFQCDHGDDEQIAALFEEFGQDDEVKVVVVRGAGGVYTSGADVKAFPDIPRDGMSHLAWNIAAAERCPKPVLCAIEKYAFGVGFELAMACDFRFATKESKLGLPEVSIGQIPGSGGSRPDTGPAQPLRGLPQSGVNPGGDFGTLDRGSPLRHRW